VAGQWCWHPLGLAHRRQGLQHSPNRPTSLSPTGQLHCRRTRFLAGELTARDRLAIVVFDDEAQVVVPSTPVSDPRPFIAAINTIHSGGCTALFDGWLTGATQVANHLDPAGMNRVLLLSDGQANEGLTHQQEIASKVAGLSARGISTSAFGLGDGFDEDLMGSIASSGDGTLAFIESPAQLPDLYASELQGLASTLGKRVSIGIQTRNGAELLDLLNDMEATERGNFRLPNLRAGQELNVGMRLQLPAWAPNQEIASVRLAWDAPGASGRQELLAHLTLPVIHSAELAGLDTDRRWLSNWPCWRPTGHDDAPSSSSTRATSRGLPGVNYVGGRVDSLSVLPLNWRHADRFLFFW